MRFRPNVQKRRQQLADGYLLFGEGEARISHLGRKLEREWLDEHRKEISLEKWANALSLSIRELRDDFEWIRPYGYDEDSWDDVRRRAACELHEQRMRTWETTQWYASQVRAGRAEEVSTAELAKRLGATSERHAAELLAAWAFDLFHQDRELWRALQYQKAREAGLTDAQARLHVKRQEVRLEIEQRPVPAARPYRAKRIRPVQYRPQIQPNAPTN